MGEDDKQQVVDKHDWGSEELSKVSDTREEKDDLKLNTEALGSLFNSSVPARPKINIKKEDLQLIMNELELPESAVRSKLIETNGDMPVIKVQTNHKNVPDGIEVRLAGHMAKVMKRPESQIFVSIDTKTRMTRGQLTDPLAVVDVTISACLTPEMTEDYTVGLCEFFQQELQLESDSVLINYRSISPEFIGFNGHILTENRPPVNQDRFLIGVMVIVVLAFLSQFLKYV